MVSDPRLHLKKLLSPDSGLKLFVGVGNVLHRDDGAGPYIVQRIHENDHIRVLNAEASIENYIGKINTINPDILILTDSVSFNEKPGYWQLLPAERVCDFTTGTHNISLNKVSELFKARVWILGIQPESVSFGELMSQPVIDSSDAIVRFINAITTDEC
jgi:hydrogenase 3 maturation protease